MSNYIQFCDLYWSFFLPQLQELIRTPENIILTTNIFLPLIVEFIILNSSSPSDPHLLQVLRSLLKCSVNFPRLEDVTGCGLYHRTTATLPKLSPNSADCIIIAEWLLQFHLLYMLQMDTFQIKNFISCLTS